MSERKLASIRRIREINGITNADAIETAIVDGWAVVVKKGEFAVGDLACYLEIDSWVPHDLAPFLSKGAKPREYNGVLGNRLRTVKLRGQVSQGLLLPLSAIANEIGNPLRRLEEGDDVTGTLGIQKWEAPIPSQLAGKMKGNFPSFIRKTDQERVQNLWDKIKRDYNGISFEVTLKLDGSSCTVYQKDGTIGVCSRNLDLLVNDDNKDNSFIKTAIESKLAIILQAWGENVAVQGELMGPGIQGNPEGLAHHVLYIFDVFDIDKQEYFDSRDRQLFYERLRAEGLDAEYCRPIPILCFEYPAHFTSVLDILEFADGPSIKATKREGLVWKCLDDPSFSFKTISNKYLLAEKD